MFVACDSPSDKFLRSGRWEWIARKAEVQGLIYNYVKDLSP